MKDQLKIQAGTSKENKNVINLTEMNVSGCLLKESKIISNIHKEWFVSIGEFLVLERRGRKPRS